MALTNEEILVSIQKLIVLRSCLTHEQFTKSCKPIYHCPQCKRIYDTQEEMLACLNQPIKQGPFKIGDIVIVGHWLRAMKQPWIAFTIPANPASTDHFERVDQAFPWYVITHLRNREHDEVASLATLVDNTLRIGWTPTVSKTHYGMWKEGAKVTNIYWNSRLGQLLKMAKVPDIVREQAKFLVDAKVIADNLL